MELKLGKMNGRELATWFGVTYNTYKNSISRYLKKLEPYCEFTQCRGGVEITDIYISTYDKNINYADQELYQNEIQRCIKEQDGLSTLSGMARKFLHEQTITGCKEDALRRRLSKTANELFGKASESFSFGSIGSREYVWAIKVDNLNVYRLPTQEENEIFNNIISACYGKNAEKVKQSALLETQLKKKEIDVDEYFVRKERQGLNLFSECLKQFQLETGNIMVHCSRHELTDSSVLE